MLQVKFSPNQEILKRIIEENEKDPKYFRFKKSSNGNEVVLFLPHRYSKEFSADFIRIPNWINCEYVIRIQAREYLDDVNTRRNDEEKRYEINLKSHCWGDIEGLKLRPFKVDVYNGNKYADFAFLYGVEAVCHREDKYNRVYLFEHRIFEVSSKTFIQSKNLIFISKDYAEHKIPAKLIKYKDILNCAFEKAMKPEEEHMYVNPEFINRFTEEK